MILKTAKCTVCGASLKLDVNKDLVNCTYCKSQIIVSNALDFAKVELDRSKDIVKLRDNLIKFVNGNSLTQIISFSNSILEIIPNDFVSNYFSSFALQTKGEPKPIYEFYSNPPKYVKEDLELVVDHIIKRSDLRDKRRIEKFLTNNYAAKLEYYLKEHVIRSAMIDDYSDIPRDIFISHSSSDHDLAEEVLKTLEKEGHKCWISFRNLEPNNNENYWSNIERAISNSKIFLVVSSEIAMVSKDIQKEINIAKKLNKKLVEYKVDNSKHTEYFKHVFDGLKWVDGYTSAKTGQNNLKSRVFNEINDYEKNKTNTSTKEKPLRKLNKSIYFIIASIVILVISSTFILNNNASSEPSINTYSINYNVDAEVDVSSHPKEFSTNGGSVKLIEPIKIGHDFLGWYDNPGFSGLPIDSIDNKAKEDIQLYPKWNIKSYTLSVVSIDDYIVDMALGLNHSIILTNKGRVFTYGRNEFTAGPLEVKGLLGVDIPNSQENVLYDITSNFELEDSEKIVRVFTENSLNSFALTNKNRLYAWGNNFNKQIISSEEVFFTKPILINLNLETLEEIKFISSSYNLTAIVTTKNRIITIGKTTINEFINHNKEIIKISSGGVDSFIFLDDSNELYAYGSNFHRLLGSRDINFSNNPVQIKIDLLPFEKVKDIQTSFDGAFVLTTFNRVFVWGNNNNATLIFENVSFIETPTEVTSQIRLKSEEEIKLIYATVHYFHVITNKNNIYRFGRRVSNVGEAKVNYSYNFDFIKIFSDTGIFGTFVLYENGFTSNKDLNLKLFTKLTKSEVVEVDVKHGTKMSEISSLNSSYYLLGDFSVIDDNFIPELSQFIYRVNS
jgi:alpha-tubulin suppressor-like RCC1 family protein